MTAARILAVMEALGVACTNQCCQVEARLGPLAPCVSRSPLQMPVLSSETWRSQVVISLGPRWALPPQLQRLRIVSTEGWWGEKSCLPRLKWGVPFLGALFPSSSTCHLLRTVQSRGRRRHLWIKRTLLPPMRSWAVAPEAWAEGFDDRSPSE